MRADDSVCDRALDFRGGPYGPHNLVAHPCQRLQGVYTHLNSQAVVYIHLGLWCQIWPWWCVWWCMDTEDVLRVGRQLRRGAYRGRGRAAAYRWLSAYVTPGVAGALEVWCGQRACEATAMVRAAAEGSAA